MSSTVAPPPTTPASSQAAQVPSPATAGAPNAQGAPPSAAETPPKSTGFSEPFAEIDRIIAETQQKTPPPPGARRPPAQTAKEPEKTVEQVKAAEEAAKAGQQKPEQKPTVDEVKTLTAPQLREAYSQRKKELAEARDKLTATEAKLRELEAKAADLEQVPKWQEKLTVAEKRAQELEEAIRFADYEKSPEYKERYYQPFVDAYQNARNKVGTLKIHEIKNDLDEVVQAARKATPEDFDAIMQIANDGEAAEIASKLFGPMANLVIYHREKVMDLNAARGKAIEDYRKQGSEREQQTMQQMQAMQEKVRGTFHKLVQEGITKYPQWFKAEEGDEAGAKMLETGFANADSIFDESKDPPELQAAKHAAFRNMAGAFPYLVLKLSRLETKLKEAEEQLTQYKQSEPNERGRERGQPEGAVSVDSEIDQMAANFRRR